VGERDTIVYVVQYNGYDGIENQTFFKSKERATTFYIQKVKMAEYPEKPQYWEFQEKNIQ
jgi:hypothetical protein